MTQGQKDRWVAEINRTMLMLCLPPDVSISVWLQSSDSCRYDELVLERDAIESHPVEGKVSP